MLANLVPLKTGEVQTGGKANPPIGLKLQFEQNANDANNFIAVLSALLSGLANPLMQANNGLVTPADSGLFMNGKGQALSIDELTKGLFVDKDGKALSDENIMAMLQQVLSQMNMAGNVQPVVLPVQQDNSEAGREKFFLSANKDNISLASMAKPEDGAQKTNAGVDQGVQSMLKASAKTDSLSSEKNAILNNSSVIEKDAFVNELSNAPEPAENVKAAFAHAPLNELTGSLNEKTAFNKDIALNNLDSTNGSSIMTASMAQGHQAAYEKNGTAIKDTLHVSRLSELGEPIIKTLAIGDKHLILKIEPPDLGSVQIRLRIDNGVLRADVKVDSLIVKDLFASALPLIKASLENSGIKVSDFSVDLREDSYADPGGQQGHNNQQQQKQQKGSKSNFFDYFA